MPGTMRGKQDLPSTQKDAASTPPSTGKLDSKIRLTSAGKGADTSRSVDASKVTGTSASAATTARQRARDRRRGRVEVSPEPDSNSPDPEAASFRIKNLAGFWSTPKDEVQVVRKKRLEVSERTEKAVASETDSSDSDSDLDVLKRAQEAPPPTETIEIEKGRAKSIANMWQNRKEEDQPTKRTPFKLDLQTEEPTVFENEPVVLEGVVRSDDRTVRDDVVIGRPGRIKDLAVNFATNSHSRPEDSADDEEESNKKTSEEVIEHGKVRNVRERWKKRQQKSKTSDSESDGNKSSETEDTPQRSTRKKDAVIGQTKIRNLTERWKRQEGPVSESDGNKSSETEDTPQRSTRKKDAVIGQTKMRNLTERWKRQEGPVDNDDAAETRRQAPARLHSLVTAKEYGVFENEPVVRDDVVRADDEQPDIISVDKSQKLRRMWTMMDKEVMKDKDREPVERVVKPSTKNVVKKETAEPEVVKPQKGGIGRLHGVKDESSKPKEEAKPRKGHRVAGREVESEKVASKDQQQEAEGRGKLQRSFTVATPGDSKPAAPKSPSLMRYASRKKVT